MLSSALAFNTRRSLQVVKLDLEVYLKWVSMPTLPFHLLTSTLCMMLLPFQVVKLDPEVNLKWVSMPTLPVSSPFLLPAFCLFSLPFHRW